MKHHLSNKCFMNCLLGAGLISVSLWLSGYRHWIKSPLEIQDVSVNSKLFSINDVNRSVNPSQTERKVDSQAMLRDLTKTALRPIASEDSQTNTTSTEAPVTLGQTTPKSISNATTTQAMLDPGDCIGQFPVKCFVFTKIEKTGSSTLFAIFARYVRKHNLNVLMQTRFVHIDWRRPKGVAWDIGPARVTQADVLINHARYNPTMIDKYVRKGYKYVVIAREPVAWFKSAAKYYNFLFGGRSPEQIVQSNSTIFSPRHEASGIASWFHLHQLQWLGFDYRKKNNLTAVQEYISYIVPKIDVVMLNEEYDASLIILKRKFGWEYPDIFYRKYIITNSEKSPLTAKATKRLLSPEVNLGEKLLYDKLNDTWWKQNELKEDDFWSEVKHFGELNWNVSTIWCKQVLKSGNSYWMEASQWHQRIELTTSTCNYLLMTDYQKSMKELGSYALGKRYNYNVRF